jgi:cobalt-factor III methyltransferase
MNTHGTLLLVSVGPGFAELIPPAAQTAISRSQYIVSYDLYLNWIRPWLTNQEIITMPLTQERERAAKALDLARQGAVVSLISSGDIGVYAMAALAFDLMEESDVFDVQVIPGISAANSCASLLGSPLSHDFATLSLSNLLCPWSWIEHRARHLAEADMTMALYNVQSKTRQQGVYQILKICQEHKSPETWCGVVRNAYREDQQVSICTLAELSGRSFDMLTTLIIGNRFTQRKRQFLYTPRGYLGWSKSDESPSVELPHTAVWVFSGTADGNALARELTQRHHRVVVSTASDYGRELVEADVPQASVVSGRIGHKARLQLMKVHAAQAIVDATHPFATEISKQLQAVAKELNVPYLRYERPGTPKSSFAHYCPSVEAAAVEALSHGKRIFLATGIKDILTFIHAPSSQQAKWFVRITPEKDSLDQALAAGIPRAHICAMQGPASRQLNVALWKEWGIDCVVTKESGDAGGFSDKLEAARELDLNLVVIERPSLNYPVLRTTFPDVVRELERCLLQSSKSSTPTELIS